MKLFLIVFQLSSGWSSGSASSPRLSGLYVSSQHWLQHDHRLHWWKSIFMRSVPHFLGLLGRWRQICLGQWQRRSSWRYISINCLLLVFHQSILTFGFVFLLLQMSAFIAFEDDFKSIIGRSAAKLLYESWTDLNIFDSAFEDCVKDPVCAAKTISGYMVKFAQVSNFLALTYPFQLSLHIAFDAIGLQQRRCYQLRWFRSDSYQWRLFVFIPRRPITFLPEVPSVSTNRRLTNRQKIPL